MGERIINEAVIATTAPVPRIMWVRRVSTIACRLRRIAGGVCCNMRWVSLWWHRHERRDGLHRATQLVGNVPLKGGDVRRE